MASERICYTGRNCPAGEPVKPRGGVGVPRLIAAVVILMLVSACALGTVRTPRQTLKSDPFVIQHTIVPEDQIITENQLLRDLYERDPDKANHFAAFIRIFLEVIQGNCQALKIDPKSVPNVPQGETAIWNAMLSDSCRYYDHDAFSTSELAFSTRVYLTKRDQYLMRRDHECALLQIDPNAIATSSQLIKLNALLAEACEQKTGSPPPDSWLLDSIEKEEEMIAEALQALQRAGQGQAASVRAERLPESDEKDLQQNPTLNVIYSRSPLAALRMLQRLRDATGKK